MIGRLPVHQISPILLIFNYHMHLVRMKVSLARLLNFVMDHGGHLISAPQACTSP